MSPAVLAERAALKKRCAESDRKNAARREVLAQNLAKFERLREYHLKNLNNLRGDDLSRRERMAVITDYEMKIEAVKEQIRFGVACHRWAD